MELVLLEDKGFEQAAANTRSALRAANFKREVKVVVDDNKFMKCEILHKKHVKVNEARSMNQEGAKSHLLNLALKVERVLIY
jgi:hypothetical protein